MHPHPPAQAFVEEWRAKSKEDADKELDRLEAIIVKRDVSDARLRFAARSRSARPRITVRLPNAR